MQTMPVADGRKKDPVVADRALEVFGRGCLKGRL
jgi:hypothetical protein